MVVCNTNFAWHRHHHHDHQPHKQEPCLATLSCRGVNKRVLTCVVTEVNVVGKEKIKIPSLHLIGYKGR